MGFIFKVQSAARPFPHGSCFDNKRRLQKISKAMNGCKKPGECRHMQTFPSESRFRCVVWYFSVVVVLIVPLILKYIFSFYINSKIDGENIQMNRKSMDSQNSQGSLYIN